MGGRLIPKKPAEMDLMRKANRLVARALKIAEEMVAPGIDTLSIDREVEALIRAEGGTPAFLGYPSPNPGTKPFPASICASINEEVVHGIPSENRVLRDGDIISVDVGVELNGFFGDAARTFAVGAIAPETQRLMDTTRACLQAATERMQAGTKLVEICRAIETTARAGGYGVVEQFVGHGIGRKMHEWPQVPNYVARGMSLDVVLPVGTILAIEPMLNIGGPEVVILPQDGWTVVTKDRSLSAHFENSVAITESGPEVLSSL